MSSSLENKVALVTGASRGIGAAIAHTFAAQGAHLVLTSHKADEVESVARNLRDLYGTDTLTHGGDVADLTSMQELYNQAFQHFGQLDVMVANAGVMVDGLIGMIRPEDMMRQIEINTLGALNHVQMATRLMRRRKSGSIILMSSIVGRVGNKGQMAYAASKAALIGAGLSAAKELGPDGIRVNILAPGFIETDLVKDLTPAAREKFLTSIALGHAGMPEEVADVALFLASPLSRYVTGQVIGVDGGLVA